MPTRPGSSFLNRNAMVIGHDLVMAAASFVLAQLLRRGWNDFLFASGPYLLQGTLIFSAVCAAVFYYMGVHRGEWRYASLTDMVLLTKAVSLAILVFLPFMFILTRLETFPRSALIINWFVLLAMLGGARFGYRLARYGHLGGLLERGGRTRVPVLLVGAGDAAEVFAREMARDAEATYRVVGLLDDDPRRAGMRIHGLKILGGTAGLRPIVAALKKRGDPPQRLILCTDDYRGERLSALLEEAEHLGLTLARLPKLTDFRSHDGEALKTRPIALEDLLGRPQTVLDRAAMRALVRGKRVLVTGAGGTIGSELVRQIAAYEPAHIALFDNAEFSLYQIDLELGDSSPALGRSAVLGDVRDRARLDQVMARLKPELVFHAAALKHVPIAETNPNEAALTNVIGTRNVADACRAADVGAMVMISTDKAVNPTSVMGATKRIAEGYCAALEADAKGRPGTRFLTVRFGNVLGSTGSVVPLFQRQLAAGGPLTVTDPGVTRYFMTVREAVELVLQASALGIGESDGHGDILVLDMGNPVKIDDLARQMIRLAGLRPEIDIKIVYTGLRPGEKLHEELFHESEPRRQTAINGIFRARQRPAELSRLMDTIERLGEEARKRNSANTLALIRALVPEYRETAHSAPARRAAP